MSQLNAFIALGSNLGKPAENILSALKVLSEDPRWQLLAYSSLYGSKPMGPQDQPDYVNAVCSVSTKLTAAALLQALHDIEDAFGRKRVRHWGERTLDLDLLLFGEQQHHSEQLRVPHPGLYERNFVLVPLADIASDWLLPNGRTVTQQKDTLTEDSLDMIICRSDISI
ncbi:2-amino-4-hydroxy-6-hydroxymethyldihydropteridine diphosphokinase [Idiomarina sp. HP20-50]|uniref:2-amino-4-hydroxy-6- hydroxymethyldihydropteridine diphosphokinase n=1 Tax=Idiomarina sp. HP20-50 TaxID=3070813 RepID=UPI00294B7664|nr:2-amino-4-hydroxy-6-hydroxymethyldihydropteridine diphosphokinase [Idiomarina sp. HP20-50]MDV6315559.1 2-amino-4-hydroxy-6-hydroxymethyldihydropteridine diphosphokinase [Idiomarina sp. HP20-50]